MPSEYRIAQNIEFLRMNDYKDVVVIVPRMEFIRTIVDLFDFDILKWVRTRGELNFEDGSKFQFFSDNQLMRLRGMEFDAGIVSTEAGVQALMDIRHSVRKGDNPIVICI